MGWAANHIFNLKAGRTVTLRNVGDAMFPLVSNGEHVEVSPVGETKLKKNQIVLVKIKGLELLYKISDTKGDEVEISNNTGQVVGWTDKTNVFGIALKK